MRRVALRRGKKPASRRRGLEPRSPGQHFDGMTRVLMFGWEFPPFQAGGLATPTLGLVKGLLNQGLEVRPPWYPCCGS